MGYMLSIRIFVTCYPCYHLLTMASMSFLFDAFSVSTKEDWRITRSCFQHNFLSLAVSKATSWEWIQLAFYFKIIGTGNLCLIPPTTT